MPDHDNDPFCDSKIVCAVCGAREVPPQSSVSASWQKVNGVMTCSSMCACYYRNLHDREILSGELQ